MTTDPLEQRLREALEAHAKAVQDHDLDRAREQEFAHAMTGSNSQAPESARSRWPWRVSMAGLAAAAVVVGGLTIGQLTDSTRTPQADPPPAASSESTSSAPAADDSAPASSTTRATPDAPTSTAPTRAPRSDAPRPARTSSAPARSTAPAPPPAPGSDSPPDNKPTPTRSSAPPHSTAPRTLASPRGTEPKARMRVAVAADPAAGTQLNWRATASGTASSDSSDGGVLGYTVDHGDGTVESRTVRSGCDGGAAVRPVTFSTGEQRHDYQRAGVFQVRVQVQYCADDGRTETDSGTRTVQIP